MRKLIIAGNWKMYAGDASGSTALAKDWRKNMALPQRSISSYARPSPPCEVSTAVKGSTIGVGAQNMYQDEGAYTGEISPDYIWTVAVST